MGAFAADLRRCADIDQTRQGLMSLFADNYGLQALLAYRLGRWLLAASHYYLWPVLPFGWVVYFLLSRAARTLFDIHIELSADIGPGLYIGHFGAIRLAHCRIGANCSIGRLTNIIPATTGPGPTIGDRVWIGAHAQIVGGWSIGPGSTIAAGAVVQRDIPAGALCLGRPARIVIPNYDNRAILALSDAPPLPPRAGKSSSRRRAIRRDSPD